MRKISLLSVYTGIRLLLWNWKVRTRKMVFIKRGIRLDSILFQFVFNIYSEYIFGEAFKGQEVAILLTAQYINNIEYEGDTVIYAHSAESL